MKIHSVREHVVFRVTTIAFFFKSADFQLQFPLALEFWLWLFEHVIHQMETTQVTREPIQFRGSKMTVQHKKKST